MSKIEKLEQLLKNDVLVEVNNETNLFNHEYILHIYELSKSNKFKQHLYSLFVFSLWYKKEYL